MKTAELTGTALDWAVAQCEGETQIVQFSPLASSKHHYAPSSKWAQGGPIIEQEKIYLRCRNDGKEWAAGALSINRIDGTPGPLYFGPTALIAAMRCYVASKLGDEINLPEELK